MTVKLTSKKQINGVALLFALAYMVSYMTRINYSAIVSEMQTATGFSKSALSMALTGTLITYGIGQLVSGFLGDKFSPKKLVLCGFLTTSLMNFLIPFCQNSYQMLVVWSVNGFAQAFMWPPMVKILTTILTDEDYNKVVTKMFWGNNIGSLLVYLCAPALIALFQWRAVFWFSTMAGLIMAFFWNRFSYEVELPKQPKPKEKKKLDSGAATRLFAPFMLFIMLAIICMGMLRDGANTWMPSYIAQTYHLSNEISILTGAFMPIFSVFCTQLASFLYYKIKKPVFCAALFFILGFLGSVGLLAFAGKNAGLSVFLFALLIGSTHGSNFMLISMVPVYFKKSGKVSTVSGVLNFCTYVGSSISTYGVALLSESKGWNFTILIWVALSAAGVAICALCTRPFQRKMA